jgi:hypothetical protein
MKNISVSKTWLQFRSSAAKYCLAPDDERNKPSIPMWNQSQPNSNGRYQFMLLSRIQYSSKFRRKRKNASKQRKSLEIGGHSSASQQFTSKTSSKRRMSPRKTSLIWTKICAVNYIRNSN